jgi:hypothetical protein
VPGRAVDHEAQAAIGRRELVGAGGRIDEFLEHVAVGLEAGRVHVGDIVGDDVELSLQHHLPRETDEKVVLHRTWLP